MTRVLKKQKTENKTAIRYFEGLNLWILAAVFVANVFFQLSEVSSSLFLYVGTFILLGILFFIDKDEYIYLFVSLLSVQRFSTIFNVSVINIITFVYFFKTYVFENEYKSEKEKRRLPKSIVSAGIFYIIFSLLDLFDANGIRSMLISVKLLFFLIYMVDVFRSMNDRKQAEKRFMNMQVYYIYGVLIAVFTSILINPSYSLDATRMSLSEDSGVNQLGISLAFCLAFVTLGMTGVTNFKEWTTLAITALPLLYYCFATQSRTSIIALIIIFASVLTMGYTQKKARLWITLMGVASVVVFGSLVLFTEGSQIHENIMGTIERFADPGKDDISGGRFELWSHYIEVLGSNMKFFFLGGNLDDFGGIQAHNMFIEMFAGGGLVGVILSIALYATVFIEIRKAIVSIRESKKHILGFLPFVLVFVTGMASHSLLNTVPTVNFCLGVAMIYFYGECNSDEDNVADNDDSGIESLRKRKRYKNIRRLDSRYSKKFRRI